MLVRKQINHISAALVIFIVSGMVWDIEVKDCWRDDVDRSSHGDSDSTLVYINARV